MEYIYMWRERSHFLGIVLGTPTVSLNRLTIRPSQWPKRQFFERCVKCIQTNHCHH